MSTYFGLGILILFSNTTFDILLHFRPEKIDFWDKVDSEISKSGRSWHRILGVRIFG